MSKLNEYDCEAEGFRVLKYVRSGIFMIVLLMVLSACGEEKDADLQLTEDIYEYLEETVVLEEDFEATQIEMNDLEKKDQELYDEMAALGNEKIEEITELVDEAIELLDLRLALINEEAEVIAESKVVFMKIEPLMEKLEDKDVQDITERLYDVMMERYDAYNVVHDVYAKSIERTKALYTLLKDEEYNEEDAFSLISDVNDSYDEVMEANDTFNEHTLKYNEVKKELYDFLNAKE